MGAILTSGVLVWCALALLAVHPANAQYAETSRDVAAVDGIIQAATQVGDRLFVAGSFNHAGEPTGSAVVVDVNGRHVPETFPHVDGTVHDVVADGYGGWVVVGEFEKVSGQSYPGFARVRPDRTVDPRYRMTADGALRVVRIAHGRVYLVGDFTTVNGQRRWGLAALDAATGTLSSWGGAFDPGIDPFTGRRRTLRNLSVSAIGVYVSGGGSPTRFPETAPAGRLWGLDAGGGNPFFERAAFVTAVAATPTIVYVGSWGYRRPLWAVDPLTGADLPWTAGLTFQPILPDDARVNALVVDSERLYLGGYFATTDGRVSVAAVDAKTGLPSDWRVSQLPPLHAEVTGLTRLGPAVVAMFTLINVAAYEVTSGQLLPWHPLTYGRILAVAPAPESVVVGGWFNGIDGVQRRNLASIDLETGEVEPWTATLPFATALVRLESDGAFLFAATNTAQFFKIDGESGALLGTVDFGIVDQWVTERLAGDRIVVVAGHSQVGVINIADWSVQSMPLTLGGSSSNVVSELEVLGNTAYLAGQYLTINGVMRPYLAAIDLASGAVLPFDASPDAEVLSVRAVNGRLFVAGRFRRIGGARRRGLAELDPVTGRALAWNADAPAGATLDAGLDGTLFVAPAFVVGGRNRGRLAAYSPASDTWLPWRPAVRDFPFYSDEHTLSRRAAFLPDCFMAMESVIRCHPRAPASPTVPAVQQTGNHVTFSWTLPAGTPPWTGLRVDVGRREGTSDLASIALPADATSLSGNVPAGAYFARVRTTGATSESLPTSDVSFATGPPHVPAPPLDPMAVAEGTMLTFKWRPPSTGAVAGYLLEAGTAEGLSDVASLPVDAGTSFNIDAPPGRYFGRLRAVNGAGPGAPSSELFIDVDATASPCHDTPPLAPVNLAASVAGRTVTLTWEQPTSGPVANTQRIVVGSAPGLDDIIAFDVPGPATSFSTVALPGTYYVRVIGINDCGTSPFSNQVRVEVHVSADPARPRAFSR
jgi:hypothetical protein